MQGPYRHQDRKSLVALQKVGVRKAWVDGRSPRLRHTITRWANLRDKDRNRLIRTGWRVGGEQGSTARRNTERLGAKWRTPANLSVESASRSGLGVAF
ncbi:unnamed protein product [Arctogadus glacialis]